MSTLSPYFSHSLHACPYCGSDGTRSVPAILRNDVRTVQTRRHAAKVGHYGYGNGGSVSFSSLKKTTSSPLVEALTPPPKPKLPPAPAQPSLGQTLPPFKPSAPKSVNYSWMAITGGLGCLGLPLALLVGLVIPFFSIIYLLAIPAGLIYFASRAASAPDARQYQFHQQEYEQALARWHQNRPIHEARAQAHYEMNMARWQSDYQAWQHRCASIELRWQRAIECWNLLFYCNRCDRVFLPQTGEHAPLSLARELLWKQRE